MSQRRSVQGDSEKSFSLSASAASAAAASSTLPGQKDSEGNKKNWPTGMARRKQVYDPNGSKKRASGDFLGGETKKAKVEKSSQGSQGKGMSATVVLSGADGGIDNGVDTESTGSSGSSLYPSSVAARSTENYKVSGAETTSETNSDLGMVSSSEHEGGESTSANPAGEEQKSQSAHERSKVEESGEEEDEILVRGGGYITTFEDGQIKIQRNAFGETVCMECGNNLQEHDIILCDGCNEEYHKRCLTSKLAVVPKEEWFCGNCLAKQLFEVDSGLNFSDTETKIQPIQRQIDLDFLYYDQLEKRSPEESTTDSIRRTIEQFPRFAKEDLEALLARHKRKSK